MSQAEMIMKELQSIRSIISEKYDVQKIALFGSYARNSADSDSDIDIMVEFKSGRATFDNFMDLKFFLEERTGKKIDLVTRKSIRKELEATILRDAIYA
jgi:predicted nucleotidyltransferase